MGFGKRLAPVLVVTVLLAACGKTKPPPEKPLDILGMGEYAGVGFLDTNDSACTGTLIAPRVVMTAAHCTIGREVKDMEFTLHPTPLKDEKHPPPHAPVERFHIHPKYLDKDENPGVDVSFVVLKNDAYGFRVSSFLPLGDEKGLKPGARAFNVGYGENFDGSHALKRAKEVKFTGLEALPLEATEIQNGLVVVGRGSKGEIGCSGDSGSPLVVLDRAGAPSVVGVYSTSESGHRLPERSDCKSGIETGNYIAISAFREWMATLALPKD